MVGRRGREAVALLVLLLMALGAGPAQDAFQVRTSLSPPQQAAGGRVIAEVAFSVDPTFYVWLDQLRIQLVEGPEGVSAGELITPEPKVKRDPVLEQEVEYFDGRFSIFTTLEVAEGVPAGEYPLLLRVDYVGCGPDLCQLRRDEVEAELTVTEGRAVPVEPPRLAGVGSQPAGRQAGGGAGWFEGRSPVMAVLAAFVLGLGLTLTPCVYPLIPVTISLVGATAGRGRLDGLFRSLVYVLGISVTYSVAGVAAALGGAQFGAWLQQPAVYLALAGVFVLLALSMFDVFTIDLTSQRLQRFQAGLRGKAGMLGIFAIGILSGAAATACIAPIIIAALLYVGQQGSVLLGFIIFFAMAWGMGTPLVALGTFTGLAKALPRSGEWMNVVKSVFGLALLAVALYFVGKSALLPDMWYRILVGAFLLGAGVFVGAFDLLSPRSGSWPRLRKTVGLLLVVGALAAFLGPLLPAAQPPTERASIDWLPSEQAAVAAGEAEQKPVMLDFWAEWCAPCKRMLQTTFVDADVVEESRRFACAKVDVSVLSAQERDRIAEVYNVRGVPTVVLMDSEGAISTHAGYIGPERMLALLRGVR